MKKLFKILKRFTNKLVNIHRGKFTTEEINHFLKYDYSYQLLEDKDLQNASIVTEQEIKFKDNIEFGCDKKYIISILRRPQHVHYNRGIKGHQILFYKSMIDGNRTNSVLHLYNNKFFLGMYLIKANGEEKKEVISKLKDSYSIDETIGLKSKIKDTIGNVIKIEDYNYLTIGYFDFKSPDFEKITKLILKRDIKKGHE
jgi:hypothetical protein